MFTQNVDVKKAILRNAKNRKHINIYFFTLLMLFIDFFSHTYSDLRRPLATTGLTCTSPHFLLPVVPPDILGLHVLCLLLLPRLIYAWTLACDSVSFHPSGVAILTFISDIPPPDHEVNFRVTLPQKHQRGGK